jgi:hypothetical protein
MTWSRAVGGLAAGADAADTGPAGGGSATGCSRPQPTAATAAASPASAASSGRARAAPPRHGRLRPGIGQGEATVRPQARNKFGINRMLSIGHIRGFWSRDSMPQTGAQHKQMLRLVTLALHL